MKNYNKFLLENIKKIKTDEYVPPELKKVISIIWDRIENKKQSFVEFFDFTKDEIYFSISFNLIVDFEESDDVDYSSNVNDLEVRNKDFKNFDINVYIEDKYIKKDEILACIVHELNHVYDLIMSGVKYNMSSFMKNPIIYYFLYSKYQLSDGHPFRTFINLVYHSLEHEIISKLIMVYFLSKYKGTYDKQQILDFFKTTYVYKILMDLKNFNCESFIQSMDNYTLLDCTNRFIDMNKDSKKCENSDDLKKYYKNWEDYFKKISEKSFIKSDKIIDELIKDIKPYMERYKFGYSLHFRKNDTMVDIFNEIVENYINI